MVRLTGISKSFGDMLVLNNLSGEFAPACITGLVGPSGSGKSVLMKIIGGVLEPDSGTVDYDGIGKNEVGLMFQEGALFDSLSLFDNVAFPLVSGQVPTFTLPRGRRREVAEKVYAVLDKVGLYAAAHKHPGQLSGGMRRRASLARALVARPKLLLLDDPTSGLDPVASSVIMNLIVDLQADIRSTTIIVSHDLRRLLPVVDNVTALFHGHFEYRGSMREFAASAPEEVTSFVRCRYDFGSGQTAHQ